MKVIFLVCFQMLRLTTRSLRTFGGRQKHVGETLVEQLGSANSKRKNDSLHVELELAVQLAKVILSWDNASAWWCHTLQGHPEILRLRLG